MVCECSPDEKSENFNGVLCDQWKFLDENYRDNENAWQEMSYNVFVEDALDTEDDLEDLEEDNYERFVDRMVNSDDFKNREFLLNIYDK